MSQTENTGESLMREFRTAIRLFERYAADQKKKDDLIKSLSALPVLTDDAPKKEKAITDTAEAWEQVIWTEPDEVWNKHRRALRAQKEDLLKKTPQRNEDTSAWDKSISRYQKVRDTVLQLCFKECKALYDDKTGHLMDDAVTNKDEIRKNPAVSPSFTINEDHVSGYVKRLMTAYHTAFVNARERIPKRFRPYLGGTVTRGTNTARLQVVSSEQFLSSDNVITPDLTFSKERVALEDAVKSLERGGEKLDSRTLGRECIWFKFALADVKENFWNKLLGTRKKAGKYFEGLFDEKGNMLFEGPFGDVLKTEILLMHALILGFWFTIAIDLKRLMEKVELQKKKAMQEEDARYKERMAEFNKSVAALDAEIELADHGTTDVLFEKGYLPITSAARLKEMHAAFKGNSLLLYGIQSEELEDVYGRCKWRGYHSREHVKKELSDHLRTLVQNKKTGIETQIAQLKTDSEALSKLKWSSLKAKLRDFQSIDPLLFQMALTEDQIPWLLGQLKQGASSRFDFWNHGVPNGITYVDKATRLALCARIQNDKEHRPLNLRFDYGNQSEEHAYVILNRLLLNQLLSLPVGKMKLHLLDLNLSNKVPYYTQRLDPKLMDRVTDEAGFKTLVSGLQEKMVRLSRSCSDVVAYNKEHASFLAPYDLVVILDAPKNLSSSHVRMLLPLLENGHKGGIFFILMNNTEVAPEHDVKLLLSSVWDSESIEDNSFDSYLLIKHYFDDESIREACVNMLNAEIGEASKTQVLRFDTAAAIRAPYTPTTGGLSVEVGAGGGGPAVFVLDLESHVHAFVLGQSGSGKSVFLRDVILGSVLKYSPADLQLYLIDLKVGGVEFNGYQRLPHTKAALLDDSDRQIVLEILRNLREELRKRGVLFREAGVGTVAEYNSSHPRARLPQTLIIVDECQRLFAEKADRVQTEMNTILDEMATMGRSYGVHLVLATQTLHGSSISAKVRKNVSDFYLLKGGMADGLERLSDEAAMLQTGQVLYTDRAQKSLFQAFFVDGKQKERLIVESVGKAKGYPDNGRFCFMGKMKWRLEKPDADALRSQSKRNLTAALGRKISMDLGRMTISLQEDMSENLLVMGSRGMDAALLAQQIYLSLMVSDTALQRKHAFFVIDNLNNPDLPYATVAGALEKHDSRIRSGRNRGEFISTLAESLRSGKAEPTVVLMLGQERFTQLMTAAELPGDPPVSSPSAVSGGKEPSFLSEASRSGFMGSRFGSEKRTYRTELQYLLENGPERGIHFVWEVDRLPNLLGDANLSKQSILKFFRHVVLLRSLPETVLRLGLPQEVDPDMLSDDPERMRAYYVDLLDNRYQLFTPFAPVGGNDIEALF